MQNNIKAIRLRRGFTQEEVAERIGGKTHKTQISRFEKGNQQLTEDWIHKFASALECEPGDIIGSPRDVPVVGYIGAGAEVFPFDDHEKGDGLEHVPAPVGMSGEKILGLRVRGDSMLPFKDGWLIFYTRENDGDIEGKCLNQLCAVQVRNGPLLLKELRRGYQKDRFMLFSYNAEPINDVEIDWCGKVVDIRPA